MNFFSDVQWAVSRADITYRYQYDIYQSPDAETSETKKLSDAFLPMTEIEPEKLRCFVIN